MSYFQVDTGTVSTPNLLAGLSTVINLRMGQSNETGHCENQYRATIGGRWDGSTVTTNLPQKNTIGYVQKKMQALDNIAFIWSKYAIGGQELVQFNPGGLHHEILLEREALLWDEYGKIDLVTMMIGETNAGVGTSTLAYEALIDDFIGGLVRTPTAFLAIGPLNMFDVPNAQEEAIRQAYVNATIEYDNFFYIPLDTIEDDHLINNHHIHYEATADEASDLIRSGMLSMLF